jgi:hypothetical protein
MDQIFGGLLNSIGLGALKPLVSTAFDFATGNIPGLLQDLTSMMSKFGDGGFTNNVAKNQPLPDAFNNSENYNSAPADENNPTNETNCKCDGNNDLTSNRTGQLFKLLSDIFNSKDPAEMKTKLTELFKLLSENANNRDTLQNNRTNMQFFTGGLTIGA